MRICSKCDQSLPLSAFRKDSKYTDGYTRQCMECKRANDRKRQRARREKNPTYAQLTHNAKWLIEYKKNLSCERCGENHPACIQFHHLDPTTKVEEIPKMVRKAKQYTLDEVKEEIEKCIVLCANCHRKEHYEQHQTKLNALLLNSD